MEYENSDGLDKSNYDTNDFEPTEPHEEIQDIDSDLGERKLNKRSLEMRRSIETYFAKKRMHELHDYLTDEHFLDDEDDNKDEKNSKGKKK